MTEKVKFLDQGTYFIQVLALEALQPGGPRVQECFVIPVMSRASGVLLALPAGYLTESLLQAGMTAGPEDLIGPSKQLTVPGVWEEVDGTELSSGEDIEVVLVDFHRRILEQVRDFEPVTEGPGILAFSADHAEVFPESSSLLLGTYSWLEEGGEGRTQYYSAEEPVTSALPVEPAPKANASKARAKSSPGGPSAPSKRVTTATLAEQLAEISKSLPVLSSRLDQVFERQTRVEGLLSSPTAPASSSVPAQRRPFEVSGYQGPKPSPTAFLRTIGSPPRVQALKESPHQDRHVSFPEDEPKQIPSEPDFALANPPDPTSEHGGISAAIFQQSQALATLVAHLVNQDGFSDLGTASGSSSMSLKGSAKREKLMSDLSHRRGDFLLKIAQNAFRRLKPSESVPRDLPGFRGKAIFSKYVERSGGFAGQRDHGLFMWLLCQIADAMVSGDDKGAQELLALAMVAVEQSAQDGGKWEVAWILSLQEDPPTGVFSNRPASTNPRLRAFSPLCPAEWAAIALSFVKEVDIINTRRQEALPTKKGGQKGQGEEDPQKKKPPRFPKKPKQGGDQNA